MFGPVVKEMSFKDISLKFLALVSIYSVEQLIYTDSVEGIMRDISVTLFRFLTSGSEEEGVLRYLILAMVAIFSKERTIGAISW